MDAKSIVAIFIVILASASTISAENERITGLVAAVFSSFHENRTLNIATVDDQIQGLIDNGVGTAFVCGTTGESLSLSIDERKLLASTWILKGHEKGLKVIVHVGHNSVFIAKDLAMHAEKNNADAVAAMPPCFFRPSTVTSLAKTMAIVAAGAPSLPFFYYHIPSVTYVDFKMIELLREIEVLGVPNFEGIKYTHNDMSDLMQCLQYHDKKYTLLFGMDQMLLAALNLGVHGAVGSTYNFAGKYYNWILGNYTLHTEAGIETARSWQYWATELVSELLEYDLITSLKETQKLMGLNVGPPRPPFFPLNDDEIVQLKGVLKNLGLL